MAECRSCHLTIRWGLTRAGRRMPFDPEPHPDGNLRITEDGGDVVIDVAGKAPPPSLLDEPEERYMAHHATCPFADQWRRR